MAKREHYKGQSYIDWLKSLGCVLWLPFAYDGDLNDRISGNDLQRGSDTTGFFAWDNNQQMMYFHSPSYTSVKSYTLQTNWNAATFPSNAFCVLTTFKRKSTSGYAFHFLVGNTYEKPVGAAILYNASANLANIDNNIHKSAFYFSPITRRYFQDGNQYATYSAYAPYLPQSWGSYDYFVGGYLYAYLGIEYYVKDIMIFNRELTLSEIRQIQEYE